MKDFFICSGMLLILLAAGALIGGFFGMGIMFFIWIYTTAEYIGKK